MHSPVFQALAREMALANQIVGTGLTAIRGADLSRKGIYSEAFFNLSIGLERMGKLIFIIDYCYTNQGVFPTDKELRKFGHNLISIVEHAKKVREKYPTDDVLAQWDDSEIGASILDCLSTFADGTRYFNLDYITNGKTKQSVDPIKLWYETVIQPALDKHYSKKARERDELKFKALGNFGWDKVIMVRFTAEDGSGINSFDELNLHAHSVRFGNKWAQLYLLRIVRFLSALLNDLSYKAYELRYDFIPHASDFFGRFYNDDKYFKSRKGWKTV